MPAIDTEAQFKFLLCCIKHSAAGKVGLHHPQALLAVTHPSASNPSH